MKSILLKNKSFILVTLLALTLTSCSPFILSDSNSWFVEQINGVGDFFKVYLVIQLSVIIMAILLSFIFGDFGFIISLVGNFIWVIIARDYGFFKVLLLFILTVIVSTIFSILLQLVRKR